MRLTEHVHLELEKSLRPGDTAIDATAGNGHDTLAIAKLVGPSGKVYAIDCQADAIGSTRRRLEAAGQLAQCAMVEGDHADILNELLGEHNEHVAAITFNLGYLPGGDKEVTTLPETTLRALDAAACLLQPAGVLLVTAYRGHNGGKKEAIHVETWMRALDKNDWRTETEEPPTRDQARVPPILWIARRKK